jgi:hypothetical protein
MKSYFASLCKSSLGTNGKNLNPVKYTGSEYAVERNR